MVNNSAVSHGRKSWRSSRRGSSADDLARARAYATDLQLLETQKGYFHDPEKEKEQGLVEEAAACIQATFKAHAERGRYLL